MFIVHYEFFFIIVTEPKNISTQQRIAGKNHPNVTIHNYLR